MQSGGANAVPTWAWEGSRIIKGTSYSLTRLTWYGLFSPNQITLSDPLAADLYRLQLGEPLTSELTDSTSGVNYRVFEWVPVTANWGAADANPAAQCPPTPANRFYDVSAYAGSSKTPSQPNILVPPGGALSLPALSGRVYLFASTAGFGLERVLEESPSGLLKSSCGTL